MRDRHEATGRFARNLRRERRRAGLSQEEEVERRAGLSRGYVGRLERGRIECRMTTMFRLTRALGIRPFDLLDGIDGLGD